MRDADAIIVGGGLSGLSLAALLGRQGVRVVCLDRDAPVSQLRPAFDGRTTAISWGSRQVLEAAGVWPLLEASGGGVCPIAGIDILDGDRQDVPLRFRSEEAGGRIFGWICENRDFRRALQESVRPLRAVRHVHAAVARFEDAGDAIRVVTVDGDVFTAPLAVGADGRQSMTREAAGIGARAWSYGQTAIVCTASHERPHGNKAVEHFRPEGPFAILPMTDDADGRHRSSIVWTVHGEDKGTSPLDWPEDSFNAALTARFPASYGAVRLLGARFAYPLGLQHAYRYTANRIALVADAAHGIHPIAGQGLNLGFRDIAALAPLILGALEEGRDPGGEDVLRRYESLRRFDNMAMAGATDILNRLFSNALPFLPAARRAGMKAVARVPAAKRFFMKQAMGSAGILPALIRDAA